MKCPHCGREIGPALFVAFQAGYITALFLMVLLLLAMHCGAI